MNPLLHYELHGREEERYLQISELNKMNYSIIFKSSFFDEEWYKSTYDLDDDVDYVEHYLKEGYKIGYDPGPDFSTNDYYDANPDVKEYGMNALVHYELYGRDEGRDMKK